MMCNCIGEKFYKLGPTLLRLLTCDWLFGGSKEKRIGAGGRSLTGI
ncbi:hypothetical protein TNCT_522051, partial [Trichonephila clavata]